MKPKYKPKSDLQRDWGSSIAVKVTAPVLWMVIIVGLIVAALTQRNLADELMQELNSTADHIAYQLSDRLKQHNGQLSAEDRDWLQAELNDSSFHLLTLNIDGQTTTLGSGTAEQVEHTTGISVVKFAKL